MRDGVKGALLQPAVLEEEEDGARGLASLLAVTLTRHLRALAPVWARCPPFGGGATAPGDGGAAEAAAALGKLLGAASGGGAAGGARLKAYVGLLQGLFSYSTKASNGPAGVGSVCLHSRCSWGRR